MVKETVDSINSLIATLVGMGLSDSQHFPSVRDVQGVTCIDLGKDADYSKTLKDVHYADLYEALNRKRMYNVKLLDGALLQFSYRFKGDEICYHRLAYLPSPSLESFQNEPELYNDDIRYADVISKQVVTFPIRFEFSSDEGVFRSIDHPKSHLTLGQYKNCRIPICSPLFPTTFVRFILRNFYNTAYLNFSENLTEKESWFEKSIDKQEIQIPHLRLKD